MKKLNNKGITLMALVITIILLIILASVGIYSGRQVVKSAQFTAFSTELKIMQTQVNSLYEKKKNNEKILLNNVETEIEHLGTAISSNTAIQNQANRVFDACNIDSSDRSNYKYFNTDTIKSLNIEGVEGKFFVNIDKRSVVSYDGFEYDGKTYYTNEQLENGLYNVKFSNKTNLPTFEVNVLRLKKNEYKITINNINYLGNVNKWHIKYKLDGEENYNEITDLNFKTNKEGTYKIKVCNGDYESEENEVIIREPHVGDRVKYEDMLQTVSDEAKTKLISDLQTYSGNIDASYNTAQTINQEKNSLQWRILDISDEKIELISAVPTESVLKFKGYDGYNNMVYLTDEACSTLYNSDKGTARNLKIEDIEKYIKYNYREYPNSSVDTGKYGGTKEYLTPIVTFFPNIYLNEKGLVEKDGVEYNGTLGQSDQSQLITGIGTVDSNIKSTHTFWRKRNLTESDFEPIYYELLINDGTKDFNYWLSSRSVFCGSDILFFEGRYVVNKTIDAVDLITNVQDLSTSTGSAMGNYLRPVVTLIPNTKLAYNELGLWEIEE